MHTAQIDALISCEKTIKTAPKKVMAADARNDFTLRNDFTCVASDGKNFEVFMKMNTKFPYLFSIGLRFRSEAGAFTICRYNGKHIHKNKVASKAAFDDFHIHKLYDEQLADGTDGSLDADATKAYVTFDEALYAFLNDCHIKNWKRYFPDLENKVGQMRLDGV